MRLDGFEKGFSGKWRALQLLAVVATSWVVCYKGAVNKLHRQIAS
jgi:hypothetical protein